MLTLTYPGDWLTVAPDAETVKRHFSALCKRYERAWGEPLIGPWKVEFQRRGAPHFHISTTPPMGFATITDPETNEPRWADFRTWLSLAWAEIVDHPDNEQRRRQRLAGTGVDYAEGINLTDPRRMAIYFAKYGTSGGKEYQHQVPHDGARPSWSATTAPLSTTTTGTTALSAVRWKLSWSSSEPVQAGSGATGGFGQRSLFGKSCPRQEFGPAVF